MEGDFRCVALVDGMGWYDMSCTVGAVAFFSSAPIYYVVVVFEMS